MKEHSMKHQKERNLQNKAIYESFCWSTQYMFRLNKIIPLSCKHNYHVIKYWYDMNQQERDKKKGCWKMLKFSTMHLIIVKFWNGRINKIIEYSSTSTGWLLGAARSRCRMWWIWKKRGIGFGDKVGVGGGGFFI